MPACRPARRLRHLGPSRLGVRRHVQRGSHPRHHPGDLPLSQIEGHRRSALPRPRYPCAVRTRIPLRPRSAGGERRGRDDRCAGRLHADPAISHAIITHNAAGQGGNADGIVITPSHNPPTDGGFKYNPPHGGPAETEITGWIEKTANNILASGLKDVKRIPFERAQAGASRHDYIDAYVADLINIIDLDAIRAAGVKIASIRWAVRRCSTGLP